MRERAASIPYLAVALSVAAYIGLVLVSTTGYNPASKIRALALEYTLLLVVVVYVLRRERQVGPAQGIGRVPGWLPLAIYLAASVPLAFLVRNGIYNADESAYLFESSIYRTGGVSVPAPPLLRKDLFFEQHVVYRGRWFGKYPPGWPALLAGAGAVKLGWLLNPAQGLALLAVAWRIAVRLFDALVARLMVLLLAASPFFVLNCVGYMSHPACSLSLAGALLLLLRGLDSGRALEFTGMFVLLGAAFLIRPSTTASMSVVLMAAMAWQMRRRPVSLARNLVLAGTIGAVAVGGLLWDNRALTGSAWLSPYAVFHKTRYPIELNFRIANLLQNARAITSVSVAKTVLHAFPFVFLLAGYALLRERRFWNWVLAALFLVLVAGYLPQVEVSDSPIGERYYFEAYFAVAILGARGWVLLRERWRPPVRAVVAVALGLVAVQVFQYAQLSEEIRRIKDGGIKVLGAVAEQKLDHAVAFMETVPGFRAKDFNPNAADWRHEPVFYIQDPGPDRRNEIACALGRPDWVAVTYEFDLQEAFIDQQGRCIATR